MARFLRLIVLLLLACVPPAFAQQPLHLDAIDNGLLILSYHDIRDKVAEVVARALRKDPDERFESAAAMLAALGDAMVRRGYALYDAMISYRVQVRRPSHADPPIPRRQLRSSDSNSNSSC